MDTFPGTAVAQECIACHTQNACKLIAFVENMTKSGPQICMMIDCPIVMSLLPPEFQFVA